MIFGLQLTQTNTRTLTMNGHLETSFSQANKQQKQKINNNKKQKKNPKTNIQKKPHTQTYSILY